MTEKGTAVIDELLQSLEDAGYTVVEVGARYRVTDPKGGDVAFIPKRLPKGANFALVLQGLTRIGFDVAAAERAREIRRQQRLAADRAKAEQLIREAEAAAQSPTPQPSTIVRTWPPVPEMHEPTPVPDLVEGGPQPRTEIIDFTPDFARALLAANRFYDPDAGHAGRCNRKYRPALAQRYAEAMLRGEWVLTEQGIGQDIDSELTNGQHRLSAVVIAGETKPDIVVPMMFTYDLPLAARDHVDSGMRRTLGDNLGMYGEKDANILGAVLRLLYAHDHLPYSARAWGNKNTISIEQARTMLALEPEVRDSAVRGATASRGSKMMSSALGVGIQLARRVWPEGDVFAFVSKLHTGANLEPGDAILALRSLLAKQKERRQVRLATEHLALFVKTWNLHHGGHRRVLIKWLPDIEPFPAIVPPSTRSGFRDRRPTGSSDPSS